MVIAALIWFLTGYILYPALSTLKISLTHLDGFTTARYLDYFATATNLLVLKNSIVLGLLTVLTCGFVGTALAFAVHYFEFPFKQTVDKILLLPVMMPGIIIVYAFEQLYGESGLVTKTLETILGLGSAPYHFIGLPGILLVHTYTQYVYFYIAVSLAIRHIDLAVLESARSLGASKFKVFTSVIRPFITPALITAAAVTFMTGIGSFAAPSIIGGSYKVLTTQILLAKANNYMGIAAVQVVVLTFLSLIFFALLRWYEKRMLFDSSVKGVPIQPVRMRNPVARYALYLLAGFLMLAIFLPFATIIVLSFADSSSWMISVYPREFTVDNFRAIFTRARKLQPFLTSVNMSLLAAFLCLLVAVPASYIIEKTRLKVRWLIEFLVILPWAMPASAVAVNLINANSTPNIFAFNTILLGTYILLPLGYFINSLPIMVKTVHISFQNLSDTLTEASKSLGASGFQTCCKVSLPTLYPGLLAGFLFVFIRSIGEYTTSTFLYTASNKPVSIAMVNAVFEYEMGLSMAYGTLLIILTGVLSLVISRLRMKTTA
ncbi:iron ABC transporter permease [Pseudodesulfovibrio sp. S3]|nr:iron ABC transporter permease [Pseudodesulfovibrio sp. S3]